MFYPNPATTISTGDVEIGAVEVKNATTDDRQIVNSSGQALTNPGASNYTPGSGLNLGGDHVAATVQIAGVDSPGGAGNVSSSTPRVVLASDTPLPVHGVGTQTKFKDTALSATKVEVSDVACKVLMWEFSNSSATGTYVQMWDLDADDVTVGTTSPHLVWYVPPVGGNDKIYVEPLNFTVGLTIAATTTPTGNTAPATALVASLVTRT